MPEEPFRILIAEDFEDNRVALKLMLKMSGFDALEACDGREAVEMARRNNPDLILMDITLPVIDGLEATRELRADAEFKQTPIIIVSAYDSPQTREDARAAGGTDYLSKPIEFDELKQLIQKHLEKSGKV
jgi:CheY-like chemotaxis protein